MLSTKRRRQGVLLGHVDERRNGSNDLRGRGKELEEEDPPYHTSEVGYWGLGESGIIHRHCNRAQFSHHGQNSRHALK